MENLLYYPYINVPNSNWSARSLLYYDLIGSIVPQEYFYEPDRFDPFMREMVKNELVVPINPNSVLESPWKVTKPFLDYLDNSKDKVKKRRESFQKIDVAKFHNNKFSGSVTKIHSDKFDYEVLYKLMHMGLAKKDIGQWYFVERKTSDELMGFIATVLAAKLNYLPATDSIQKKFTSSLSRKKYHKELWREQQKRELILEELIPFPRHIDFMKMRKFKDKYSLELNAFKTKVELIVLDPAIEINSKLFRERIKELNQRKKELSIRMTESKVGDVFFGTVCGILGAFTGLQAAGTPSAIISALPGFANAIHSALKIERVENLPDQSGMKYLALIDTKLGSTEKN